MGLGCSRRLREISDKVLLHWVRLIRSCLRIRRLQRLWGQIGARLRLDFSQEFKLHLTHVYGSKYD